MGLGINQTVSALYVYHILYSLINIRDRKATHAGVSYFREEHSSRIV